MDTAYNILMDTSSFELSFLDIALRFLCAMLVGLVIGTEREYTNRPAGMRTHILVALGACSVMIVGQVLFAHYSSMGATPDPARLSAQVITGVGFLGAGTIMREGTSVKGLTTAASLWSVACLGIAAGAGYYYVALVGMVLIFITLTLLEVVQNKLVGAHGDRCSYCLETNDVTIGLRVLHDCAKECRVEIGELLAEKADNGTFSITFHAELGGSRGAKRRHLLFEKLASHSGIISVYQKCDLTQSGKPN